MVRSSDSGEVYENLIDYSVVNSNIRKYREKANLTQEQLAEKSHISSKYLSRLENNYYKGRLHIYVQIAVALNISLYDLIGNADDIQNDFSNQINLLAQNMTSNQKEMLFESIKLIKKYKF